MINTRLKTLYLLLGITCLFSTTATSQHRAPIISINNIPAEGILLDSGWRFKIGDDPGYAQPGYDDSGWAEINPTMDIHNALPQIPEGDVCWIRIHLSIDSTISQLEMMIEQSIASEIYLNGKLIHLLGTLSSNRNEIKAVNPKGRLYSFPFEKRKEQTLAIRFAKQPGIGYGTHWNSSNPAASISLNTVEAGYSYYKQRNANVDTNTFLIGIFFILAILYLAFYVFYPDQKANLLFSLYALLMTIGWASFRFYTEMDAIQWYPYTKNGFLILAAAGSVIMLAAIYNLLKLRKDWLFYFIVTFAVLCIPIGVFFYEGGWNVYGGFFTNTFHIAVGWIVFRSFRNNARAAWLIAIGVICFETIWFMFSTGMISSNVAVLPYVSYIFALAQLSMPVAVSVYLGYDFALTNRSLKQKLDEVHRLSEEKQQILTTQNETLEKEVLERTAELKNSIEELKATQTQLIQSEKMASLGELTAGIAHEIQNPLNFVNNFAEVNKELIGEMNDAIEKGNFQEVKTIARNIADNQDKINHHGQRADAIVKSMLQHSRSGSGQKEPTDINALCDEYLRLTYHGYRARDRSFTAKVETDFDSSLGKTIVVTQDIGRVVLNLISNAFYAVIEKQKQKGESFTPQVRVSTKKLKDKIQITVGDNGTGIPNNLVEKIFQPFFTTKPAGQGTGLGLSLAYDIVTKGHGGELKVKSVEGEGSEFTITLPVIG